jgi:PPOX class probable FMN-dependent enzyme
MSLNINEPVVTQEQLRAILPKWTGNASKKDGDCVNEVAAAFIARSPYVVISSADVNGRHDVSPKGDAPGFVRVYDEKTLIIPDRLGNHRLDTFENILANPHVGLFFMIPGHSETLRLAGTARIARDQALREQFAVNGRLPELVLVVNVEQVFMHCSKSLMRSRLWQEESWASAAGAPSLAQWVKSAVQTDATLEEVQNVHDQDRELRLY